jgi:hypothetical protein
MVRYKIDEENRVIKCVLIDFPTTPGCKTRKSVGIARCANDDEWDVEVGKRIAFKRARQAEIGNNISDYLNNIRALDNVYNNIRSALERKIKKQYDELNKL